MLSDGAASLEPLVRLLTVFCLMLAGMRIGAGLGLSVLGGGFILAIWSGMNPVQWALSVAGITQDRATMLVCLVLALILALAALMESTGQAERFMKTLSHHIRSPKIRLVFFPMLIGLLPMPGGAVFSAPLIEAVARDMPIPEVDKSLVNYWFRHTAEMAWPLFPAVILAAGIAGIPTPSLILYTSPLVLGFFTAGWFTLVRGLPFPAESGVVDTTVSGNWSNVLRQGLPIFVALGGAIFLELVLAFALPDIPVDYGVPPALTAGIALCLAQNSLRPVDFVRAAFRKHVVVMIGMVGALGAFKIILEDSGLVRQLMQMGSAEMMLLPAAVGLPLLVGLVTGLLMACVGVTLPLLMVLVPQGESVLPWLGLSLSMGFAGTMISPLHICFVLSCEYFQVKASGAWRRLPAPCLLFATSGALWFFLTH